LYSIAADPRGDLAAGALWIAAEEYPDLDPLPYLEYLDECAERVVGSVDAGADEIAWRRALAAEIYGREGFAGNSKEYYDPRNSHLNQVIDRRRGIPITLAIVYLAVAHRIGRAAAGVNAPGHFLVLHGEELLDPFHGARIVEREALLAQLEQAGAPDPKAQLEDLLEHPTDTRAILVRVLVNLRLNHLRRRDPELALTAVDRLVHLDPANPSWLRDRAALFQRLECAAAAIRDLEGYLERVPDDPEAPALRQAIAKLRPTVPSLQ